jgi:hypothetical protein
MGKDAKPSAQLVKAVAEKMGGIEDEIWLELGLEVVTVVDRSNAAYGDSTEKSSDIMQILWPDGVPVDRMHDFRCMMSILDKLSRIATDKDAFGESPWRDVAGYALLAYRHDLSENTERDR